MKGFTLIELLVVVLIIGVLSAIALPQYTVAVEKSRATEAFSSGKAIVEAMNRALNERPDELPDTLGELDIRLTIKEKWNADRSQFSTENFQYDISDGRHVSITRDLGDGDGYTLTLYNNASENLADARTCRGLGEDGAELCQSFVSLGFDMVTE